MRFGRWIVKTFFFFSSKTTFKWDRVKSSPEFRVSAGWPILRASGRIPSWDSWVKIFPSANCEICSFSRNIALLANELARERACVYFKRHLRNWLVRGLRHDGVKITTRCVSWNRLQQHRQRRKPSMKWCVLPDEDRWFSKKSVDILFKATTKTCLKAKINGKILRERAKFGARQRVF